MAYMPSSSRAGVTSRARARRTSVDRRESRRSRSIRNVSLGWMPERCAKSEPGWMTVRRIAEALYLTLAEFGEAAEAAAPGKK